jgi:hypothetical protein
LGSPIEQQFRVTTMKNWLLAAGVAAILTAPGLAYAASPTLLSKFNDWVASTYDDNGKTLCYATSEPRHQTGAAKGRSKAYIAVTHVSLADSNLHDQVSYIAGYELKPSSTVKLVIGKESFSLDLLQKDRAWAKDADADKALVAAMRKGNSLIIRGTSAQGGEVVDSYSLSGFSKAYQAISGACKVK